MFNPRPKQAEILSYESGMMGVAAVPGSGKTHTLSYLAALLITKGLVSEDQEILVVTLVNSAVENFSNRISQFIRQAGLLQKMGYRVRTLHGLAHDIIRERPDLAGVSEHFTILDENEGRSMIEQISTAYLRDHPEITDTYLEPTIDLTREYSTSRQWQSLFADISASFIKQAKDFQLDQAQLKDFTPVDSAHSRLYDFGVEVFTEYQRGLRFRNALDFSDLTRLALRALESDERFLTRLQYRWPYILEDEAQDSSSVQEAILRRLIGATGNWVRVGDTNQAIYDTFTTADPEFLRRFLKESGVIQRDLPNSGRSNKSIIGLANKLIRWTNDEHPVCELRDSLSIPYIEPAPPDDPQPNPPDHENAIYIHNMALTPEQEIKLVTRSIEKWLPENMGKTVAVLCPIGHFAEQVVEELQKSNVEVVELLQSSNRTRKTVRLLEKCLSSISDPSNVMKFCNALDLHMQFQDEKVCENPGHVAHLSQLKKLRQLEDVLYPKVDAADGSGYFENSVLSYEPLKTFAAKMRRWHKAAVLPIDQLIIIISNDLFSEPQDLALAHKLSLTFNSTVRNHPEYRLPQFIADLTEISHNERKFQGFGSDESGFNPEVHKGKVLVSTYHKAKGLEWDRVYLMSVNNYDFPSLQENDQYKSEKWFVRGNVNLEAELLSFLKDIGNKVSPATFKTVTDATTAARQAYAAERLRLFYVGITRARESLIITWNTGRRENCTKSLPLQALEDFRKEVVNVTR